MKSHTLALAATLAAALLAPSASSAAEAGPRIEWDASTLVRVQSGTYGRMIRLANGSILCGYEAGGKSWVSCSIDNGKSWGAPILVREISGASAANPEMVQLKSGRVLFFYNQRPNRPDLAFAIGMCHSDDGGATWKAADKLIYEAGRDFKNGCWEPAALQLPAGEIQLFFANEAPFPNNDDQEITLMRSFDNGASWDAPERVAYRPRHRDGMPVPILLRGQRQIVFAIEDNGLAPGYVLQPAIIASPFSPHEGKAGSWKEPVGANSPRRWSALATPLPGNVYAGAPYLRQMPGGETILSVQSREGGREKERMVVYVGDAWARNFQNPSVPFDVPGNVAGLWNSLFVKDARTVTAISDVAINGVRGLWAIDGRLVP